MQLNPGHSPPMATLHVLRVFTGPDGGGGNPLGIFLDGSEVAPGRRQAVAAELGFSETVFVDDAAAGAVRIFTPAAELPFAGHPLVGTSWLLREQSRGVDVLRPPAGEVPTWADDEDRVWIRGRADWAPEMELRRLPTPAAVDALTGSEEGGGFVDAWAWHDEQSGVIRCRVFAPRYGIAEDEATGAAAVRLVAQLGRRVEIHQGSGSLILGRPGPAGSVEIGGRCVLVDVRSFAAAG